MIQNAPRPLVLQKKPNAYILPQLTGHNMLHAECSSHDKAFQNVKSKVTATGNVWLRQNTGIEFG